MTEFDACASRYTGKERDSESGLDYFGARYLASSMGRFMSPDPVSGRLSNPQTLNAYAYVLNNPLVLIDPTGMVVEWHDSKAKCEKGETVCRTKAQRSYENRLSQMLASKDAKERAKGASLAATYKRLQDSKSVFEVVKGESSSGTNGAETTYEGNDHFRISINGNDPMGMTDKQMLAHEFEHGRQVLDGELGFKTDGTPIAHDLIDEAKAFQAGFDIKRVSAGQGSLLNGLSQQLGAGGIQSGAKYLGENFKAYRNLPMQINVPNPPPPNTYVVPK